MTRNLDYPDHVQCDNCTRVGDPSRRCDCTFMGLPAQPDRPWRVVREGDTFGTPFASEMMARAYVEGFGGTLTEHGRVVGAWPVPSWYRDLMAEGKHAAALKARQRPGSPA